MNERIYPGFMDENVEFFVYRDDLKAIQGGKVLSFTEFPFALIQLLEEAIELDEKVKNSLFELYPESRLKRIETFAKCRFGGLDYEADIKNGVLTDGDYWDCPLRGSCKHEGILCKLPQIKGYQLSNIDVALIRQSTTDKTNEVIAGELSMPLGTFHKHKRNLYAALEVQTKQEITLIAIFFKHNLITMQRYASYVLTYFVCHTCPTSPRAGVI